MPGAIQRGWPKKRTLPPKVRFRSPGRRGFTLVELLIVAMIVMMILGWAAPRYAQARVVANEAAAQRSIRAIHQAQAQYYSEYGRHAASLAELGTPKSTRRGPAGADLITGDLATGEKHGYRFEVLPTKTGYQVRGRPILFGITGKRTFLSDETFGLFQSDTQGLPRLPETEAGKDTSKSRETAPRQ